MMSRSKIYMMTFVNYVINKVIINKLQNYHADIVFILNVCRIWWWCIKIEEQLRVALSVKLSLCHHNNMFKRYLSHQQQYPNNNIYQSHLKFLPLSSMISQNTLQLVYPSNLQSVYSNQNFNYNPKKTLRKAILLNKTSWHNHIIAIRNYNSS